MRRPSVRGPEELPCVWVLAGVLSYRPCHREFDCDGCELYHALRGPNEEGDPASAPGPLAAPPTSGPADAAWDPSPGKGPIPDQVISSYLARLTGGCTLHLDRPYTPRHFWVMEEDGEVQVGLDCQTLRVLYPLDDFTLPRPGVWLKRGETMGWVQRGHLILPLTAPISGEVLEVNEALVEEIKRLGFPDEAPPWLLRLAPREPMAAVPDLLTGESMLHWYEGKLALLRNFLQAAVSLAPEVQEAVGPTLNDGGEPNLNLEEVLGPTLFQQLLERLFPPPQ
jgi:glycine cleavage system H protein